MQHLAPPGAPQSGAVNAPRAGLVPRPAPAPQSPSTLPKETVAATAPAPALARPAQAGRGATLREPGVQQRLGQLQQGQVYVQQLGAALQALKSGLSQSLALGSGAASAELQSRLDAVDKLWRARSAASGGQLDAQLRPVAAGAQALQRFSLRGLDVQSLTEGGAETLRLSLPGQPRPVSIYFDGQGLDSHLQALQRGLAPLGVQVAVRGEQLQFSVAENRWPGLRDGLSLRGDGRRFPSGMPLRAPLDAEPPAMAPQSWSMDGAQAQRTSLARVLQAQQQLGQAAQQLGRTLARANALPVGGTGDAGSSVDAEAVQRFAAAFAADGSPGAAALDYERLAEMAPALLGLHRDRVQQLLLDSNAP